MWANTLPFLGSSSPSLLSEAKGCFPFLPPQFPFLSPLLLLLSSSLSSLFLFSPSDHFPFLLHPFTSFKRWYQPAGPPSSSTTTQLSHSFPLLALLSPIMISSLGLFTISLLSQMLLGTPLTGATPSWWLQVQITFCVQSANKVTLFSQVVLHSGHW